MDKHPNFRRLDIAAFAKAGQAVQQTLPIGSLTRLAAEIPAGIDTGALQVEWRAAAELRRNAAGESTPWLHCEAHAVLPLLCQRCLEPVATALHTSQWFRFVATEAQAELEDEEAIEDVLALEGPVDVLELIEDDLLMALPPVAKHDACQPPAPLQREDAAFDAAMHQRRKPFAQLAELATKPLRKGGEQAD